MNVEFINPFLHNVIHVLAVMGHTDLHAEKPKIKKDDVAYGDVSGLIGMVGPQTKGSFSITFEKLLALRVMHRMLGENPEEINEEVTDMVGEITNMVTGGAKKDLAQKGYDFEMATPMVVSGPRHTINHKHEGHVIIVPFTSDSGKLFIEICFD
jgi:chemotaxis protein CheX